MSEMALLVCLKYVGVILGAIWIAMRIGEMTWRFHKWLSAKVRQQQGAAPEVC